MKLDEAMAKVGKARVIVTDEETGEEIGRGVLQEAFFQIGSDAEGRPNQSQIVVAADIPPKP